MAKIFISIASYRDPELLPTLENLLANASNENELVICIAWQHAEEDTWDTLDIYKHDPRFKIIDIPYQDAQGVCWARYLIQESFEDEDYYLQLDSHHRFTKDWDKTLLDYLHFLQCKGHYKPILSSYLPGYFPKNDPEGRNIEVWGLNIDRFMPAGVPFLRPFHITDYLNHHEPIPSRFVSGHFIFTIGKFVHEVPYDPNLYFHGEESSLSGRAYTHGYDLFAPHRPIIWHEYTREGKKKHWDDSKNWSEKDKASYARFRKIFDMDEVACSPCQRRALGNYALGSVRSLEEYEKYAGLKFKTRQVHQETLENKIPPIKGNFESGLTSRIKTCIDVYKGDLPEEDYDVIVIALLDKDGNEIYRQDANELEIRGLLSGNVKDRFIHIWRDFDSLIQPTRWRVWPHSISKGWQNIIENEIGHE